MKRREERVGDWGEMERGEKGWGDIGGKRWEGMRRHWEEEGRDCETSGRARKRREEG